MENEIRKIRKICDDSGIAYANELGRELNDLFKKKLAEKDNEIEKFKSAEKDVSDAYLRIRELVGAWDTNWGGKNRFEVTENKVRDLKQQLDTYKAKIDGLREVYNSCKKDMNTSFWAIHMFNAIKHLIEE